MRSRHLVSAREHQALAPGAHRGLLVHRGTVISAAADAVLSERGRETVCSIVPESFDAQLARERALLGLPIGGAS